LMTINRHNIGAWASVAETIGSMFLLWYLVPRYGITGAALAIAVPTFLSRTIVIPLCVARVVRIQFSGFLLKIILFAALTAGYVSTLQFFVPSLNSLSLAGLLMVAPVIGALQIIIGFSLFTTQELD